MTNYRGELCHTAKLTEDDVRIILDLLEERKRMDRERKQLTNKAIADKFDVHYRTIDRVVQGRSWIRKSPVKKRHKRGEDHPNAQPQQLVNEAWRLRQSEGLPAASIAKKLGIPSRTVADWIYRQTRISDE